jgi:hypothetical protein
LRKQTPFSILENVEVGSLIIDITEKLQIHATEGGSNWSLVERKVGKDKDGNEKESFDVIGHYGRPDQAMIRALNTIVFDRAIERLSLVGVVRRLEAAEKRIMDKLATIDRSTYDAAVAARDAKRLAVPSANAKKREMQKAEKAINASKSRR